MACALFAVSPLSAGADASRGDVTGQLTSSRADTRAKAAMDVAEHRATADVSALTAASQAETRPETRVRMLMAAFEVDSARATPFLVAALRRDPSPLVRAVAAQVLTRVSPNDAVRKAFIDGLAKDRDSDVRRACATALGYHHTPDAAKALSDAAADADPEVRGRVGAALLRHPRSAATDRVLDRLEGDRDPKVSAHVRTKRRGGSAASR